MTIETANFISELNSAYPDGLDKKKEGDNHIRLMKAVIKATFPGLAGRVWRIQEKSSAYTVVATDNMTVIRCTAAMTLSLTAAATLGNGFRFVVMAASGDVVIDPTGAETVDDAATLTVVSGTSVELFCDGDEFYTASGGGGALDGTLQLIRLNRVMTGGGPPSAGDLTEGELYVDFVNQIIYGKNAGGSIVRIGGEAPGVIKMWGGASIPPGYLNCDGSVYNISSYPELGAELGATWGGNGTTTFAVPDLRGRAPIGVGTGAGLSARVLAATTGAETVTLTSAQSGLPAHTHTGSADAAGAHTHNVGNGLGSGSGPGGYVSGSVDEFATLSTTSDGSHTHTVTINANAAADAVQAHNNMQPSAAVYFIIKT